MSNGIRWRLVFVAMLGTGSLVLFMANRITDKIDRRTAQKLTQARPLLWHVNEVIDTLLERYQIDGALTKSWSVLTPDRRFIREERRVSVPQRFMTLDFNHDLNRELAKYGLRVVATERTKESTVVMHVINNGMVIESITFVLGRDLK